MKDVAGEYLERFRKSVYLDTSKKIFDYQWLDRATLDWNSLNGKTLKMFSNTDSGVTVSGGYDEQEKKLYILNVENKNGNR